MKSPILLLAVFVLAISSCTTAHKTGQTVDDVYYSAGRPQKEDDRTEKDDRRDYTYDDEYYDDRYLRMKVSNRYRWNELNDWYYYDRYSYGYNYYYGSYYNPYNSWNYYYNPYCCCHGNNNYSNPKIAYQTPAVKPRAFNLGGYTNNAYNNSNNGTNGKGVVRTNSGRPVYNNSNNNSEKGSSNSRRTIYDRNNNNNSNGSSGSSSSSSRTYSPSSSSSSSSSSGSSSSGSSSSGSSSGGGVSRPGRN